MTLPIAISRPAPDGNAPAAHEGAHATPESNGVFKRALASAMDGETSTGRAARGRGESRAVRARHAADARHEQRGSLAEPDNRLPAGERPEEAPVHSLPIEYSTEARLTFAGALLATEHGAAAASPGPDAAPAGDEPPGEFIAQSLEEAAALRLDAGATVRPGEHAVPGTIPAASPAATTVRPAPGPDAAGGPGTLVTTALEHRDREATLRAAAATAGRAHASRDLEGLVPDMRTRLERVIARMESEYGYTVEVVETVRSQERQDTLFAQGRTRPGPVVTWTRNSKHIDGRAADVVIDGGYDNAAGFERLARVAREEGLRTLWPRDPGHIELTASPAARRATPGTRAAGEAIVATPQPAMPVTTPPVTPPPVPRTARAGIDPAAGRVTAPVTAPVTPSIDPLRLAVPPVPSLGVPTITGQPANGVPLLQHQALERALVVHPNGMAAPGLTAPATRLSGGEGALAPAIAAAGGQSGMARVARVATVAPVADVARVARVARVAEVAVPGQSGAPAPVTPDALMPGQVIAGESSLGGRALAGDGGSARERGEGRDARDDRTVHALPVEAAAERSDRTPLEMAREILASTGPRGEARDGDGSPVAGLARSDATERIARVLRLQEAGGDRPLSSVLLRLDSPDGGEDRIRIDMRGRSIGATLDVADARAAEQLRAHVPELQEALQRQGLEGDAFVVRSASRNSDVATLTASAASAERDLARAASTTASDGGGSTARDSRNPPRGSLEREGTDQQRSRQRRDGKEGRQ